MDRFTGDVVWEFDMPDDDLLHASAGIADGLVFWGDCTWPDSIAYIHAVDERIPIEAVDFGANAIYRLLRCFGGQ